MTTIYVLLVVAPTRLVSSRPGYSKRTVQTQSIEFEQKTLCVAQRSYLLEIHREVGGARLSGEFLQVPTVPYLLTSYHLLSSSGGGGLYVGRPLLRTTLHTTINPVQEVIIQRRLPQMCLIKLCKGCNGNKKQFQTTSCSSK